MENEKLIMNKLDVLKKEVGFIKEHILDLTLAQDDIDSINEAEKDLREGRTTSIEDLKKELRI